MVKKIMKNVKSYHFVYVILVILLIAGAGTGIYFYIKNKSASPHRAPTTQCESGKVECSKDGSIVCCDACCGGVCLKKGFTCIDDGIQCEDKMVCGNPTTGEKTCCTTESPNCNETLGVCNACTPINPQCEGTTDGKNPICCGLNGNDCYTKYETTTNNPCVCSGGDGNGMGGQCCSKNRSLCPGESYGQVNIRDKDDKKHITRDSLNKCLFGSKNKVCITPLEDGTTTVAVEDIAIDDIGNQCHQNLIYKSESGKYLCCGIDGSKGQPSLYLDSDNTLKCCTGNKIVGGESMCYSKNTFSQMNNESPLEGKCSGSSSDASKNAQVCVNPIDFKSSSLSAPPCKDPEISVDLPYYDLINQPGKISYQNNGKDVTNCPSGLSGDSDCNKNLPVFLPGSCTSDTDCNNKSNLCKDKEGNVHPAPCNPLAKNPTYKTGICGVGCPTKNPTTTCDDGEICYTYEAKNKEGKPYESGFCGLPPKSGQQNPTSTTIPEHLVTKTDNGNMNLYYKTEANCKNFCGARYGYCDQVNMNGNILFTCKLPVCSAGNKSYIYNDSTVNLSGSNTITYNQGGTMAQCMLDQNKQYIDRITFNESTGSNSSASCTGEFDCTQMLTVPNDVDKMTPTYVKEPIRPGETLYKLDGTIAKKPDGTNIISGPFTYTYGHGACLNKSYAPNGIFCGNGDSSSCCGSAPAGIY